MQFQVLGRLLALDRDGPVSLGGPQQQTVLAVLLAHANSVVSTDRLIDEVWGESPPDTARKAVQSYVAQLRKAINVEGELLRGESRGYVVEVKPDQVDSLRFEELIQEGRERLRADPDDAAALLQEALGLWRGQPFADLGDEVPSLRDEAVRLEGLRLTALEDRIEADLVAGNVGGLTAELERLTAEHPYRERLWGLLMLALYRSGRQTDALRSFEQLRRGLADDLGLDPSPELQRLEQRILDHDSQLESSHPFAAVAPQAVATPLRNPYKGLRAFQESDASDFFGRGDLVRRLVDRLGSRGPEAGFLALIGPSGSGKSSVLWAGLVPALASGAVPGSEGWRRVACYPGNDPFGNLAESLTVEGNEAEEVADSLRRDRSLPDGVLDRGPVLLVIDQLEELFTLSEEDVASDFMELLASMALQRDERVRLVVTLRSDFVDTPLRHPTFAAPLEQGLLVVTPLQDHEVRAAVTEPAASMGVRVAPELVAEITRDVGARPAALPLLQYALTDLFDRRRGDQLTIEAYHSAGGILGALSQRASDIYDGLDESGQEAARQVLLRLVTVTDEAEHLRRRVGRAELEGLPFGADTLGGVLEAFGQHRLLTFDRDPVTGEATVEVAHEALLREWPRLRHWIDESRDDLRIHRRLTAAATDWTNAERDPGYLSAGPRLAQFESVASGPYVTLTRTETEFIEEGGAHERRLTVARTRRRRAVSAALVVAAVVTAVFGVVAVMQRNEARQQTRFAFARELAASALANIDDDPQLSILLALEAAAATDEDGVVMREAVEALHAAVLASRVVWVADLGSTGETIGARFSPDGSRIAAGSVDGSVRIFDAATGDVVATFTGHEGHVQDVRWMPDGNLSSIGNADGTVRLWQSDSGVLLETWTDINSGNLDVSPDGSLIAASSFSGDEVVVWNTATGNTLFRVSVPLPVGVSFDPSDGARLAVASFEFGDRGGGVFIFDVASNRELLRVPLPGGACDVAWSPDGVLVGAAGVGNGGDVVLQAATGREVAKFDGHRSATCSIRFSADGEHAVTGGQGGAARTWEITTGREVVPLLGHTERVGFVDFSPDGSRVLSTSPDGTLRVWDVSLEGRREKLAVHDPSVTTQAIYIDGTDLFLAGSQSGVAGVWNSSNGALVHRFDGRSPLRVVAAAPVGDVVATGSGDGTVALWSLSSGVMVDRLDTGAEISGLAISPDARLLAYGAGNVLASESSVHLIDRSTGEETPLHDQEPGSGLVSMSPDGARLATSGGTLIEVWDSATGERVISFDTGNRSEWQGVLRLAFDDNGTRIIATTGAGPVAVVDPDSGELLQTFAGNPGGAPSATMTADGSLLASAGFDGTVRLWDTQTGEEVLRLHDQQFTSVDFSEDGSQLLVAGDFGVRTYEVNIENLIDLARSRLVRSWTADECSQYLGTEGCP